MSNYVESNAHRVICSAFAAAYMKGIIAAKPLTGVYMTANSVRVVASLVVRGTFYDLWYLLSTQHT